MAYVILAVKVILHVKVMLSMNTKTTDWKNLEVIKRKGLPNTGETGDKPKMITQQVKMITHQVITCKL